LSKIAFLIWAIPCMKSHFESLIIEGVCFSKKLNGPQIKIWCLLANFAIEAFLVGKNQGFFKIDWACCNGKSFGLQSSITCIFF